jgi:site-specific recombinase XerC
VKALPIQFDESIPAWEKAIYAFLAEKERRSGSMRTVDAYTRTLQRFFGTLGKTPEQVTPPDVFGFAHGIGPSGREPAAITIGARLACISSFYRFLIRMEIVTRNPRPTTSAEWLRSVESFCVRCHAYSPLRSPGDGSRYRRHLVHRPRR